jgi:hypothetical protein
MNKEVQRQVAAAMKAYVSSGSSSSPKKKVRTVSYHQNPTHSSSAGFPREEADTQGEEEGEESGQEGLHTTLGEGTSYGPQTPGSYRRQRSQEEWARREGKRKAEAAVEVLKRKPWTFGVPNSYPDELLTLPHSYQADVLLSRASTSLLDANRFRSPIHVQPGLDVPIQIQHDLSASLKFMFETQIDKSLIQEAYTDLVRRIRWKWHFIDRVGSKYDPDYDVSALVNPDEKKEKKPPGAHPHIERGLAAGQDYVSSVMTSIPEPDKAGRTPCPLNLKRAREFMVSNHLIVTATDKNLGVAVFKREWIYEQACALFDDKENYVDLTKEEALHYLSNMADAVRELCESYLEDGDEQLSTYLSHCLPDRGSSNDWACWKRFVPEAYAIPKIHKKPWKGRPICPGFCLPQNAASKVLAKTLRPFIEQHPWVIKGSKDFVQKLKDVKIPNGRRAFIVSADVVAFYPSVDTGLLREMLRSFAEHTIVPKEVEEGVVHPSSVERRLAYYEKLFHIAIAGPVMTFNDRIIFQHKGLPMGAAGSPDAANTFALWYELQWMERVTSNDDILFYGRYLDDVYCIVLAESPDEATGKLSFISLGDVKLLWEPPSDKADFLDLSTRIDGDRIFHEPFVKAMSHRERIPWSSAHPLDVKRGTFCSEISRLATLCSDKPVYVKQCEEAVNLYIGRGYPPALVTKWLKDQQEKRWETRIAVKSVEDPACTYFTLKTHFNDAWYHFNVGELQTRITSHWASGAPESVVVKRKLRKGVERSIKRVKVTLQGAEFPGQSRLDVVQVGSSRAEPLRFGAVQRDNSFAQQSLMVRAHTAKWINTAKFLVSRKKNTQLWDITRSWNKVVWEKFQERSGMLTPFDPSYEGLVVPNEEGA